MNILWCVRWSFRVKSPQKINKIKKHDVPDLYRSLHRIRFYSEFWLQFRQHGNVSIIKMWSFLKHYDGAQPGKRKTASATTTGDWESLMTFRIYCYCNLNKNFKNYVLNLVNFSKFEGIPRPGWIWLLFFGAWFQLFGLFWMVTGLSIFRPLLVPMKLNTESALLD